MGVSTYHKGNRTLDMLLFRIKPFNCLFSSSSIVHSDVEVVFLVFSVFILTSLHCSHLATGDIGTTWLAVETTGLKKESNNNQNKKQTGALEGRVQSQCSCVAVHHGAFAVCCCLSSEEYTTHKCHALSVTVTLYGLLSRTPATHCISRAEKI